MSAAPPAPPAAPSAPKASTPPPGAAPPSPGGAAPPARPGATPVEHGDEGASWLEEAGNELREMDEKGKEPRKAQPPKPPQKPEEQKPIEGAEELEDGTKPPGDEQKPVEGEGTAPPPEPEKPIKAAELRKAYENSQRVIKEELTPKISKLEARIKELESADPGETGPIAEQIKTLKTRNEGLEARMRLLDYSQSEEYQEKYFKPYVEAWDKCMADLAGLEVELANGETRKATDADIQRLAALPLGEQIKQTNALFGDAADVVREHIRAIVRTNDAQTRALEDAKKNAETHSKTNQQRALTEQANRAKLWEDSNAALREKYPNFFAPKEGDSEGNKLLQSGYAMTSLVFSTGKLSAEEIALLPNSFKRDIETQGKLSPENMVRLHALIRNKAANHDRLARQIKVLRAQLAEKDKTLAEYQDSEPPTDGRRAVKPAPAGKYWDDDPNQEIDELDRKGR